MPTIPAPTAYRDRDNLSMEQRGLRYADMLEEKILAEGPESVARLHHGADRRRGDRRAGAAGQLFSRASAKSATNTASCSSMTR